ncbi:MAG: helix-turn-helix transcriptional regulator [Bacteroidales bacterium]|jgi:DNA-binding Xre family transcriptional regulator|nr:helix-turn-helix transcriptional regulator [Bacteroidales bacterium]
MTGLEKDTIEMFDYFNLEKGIKFQLKEGNITFKKLCQEIGMTENGLKASLKNRTVKLTTLLQVCNVLDITIYHLLFGKDDIDFRTIVPSYDEEVTKMKEELNIVKEKYKELTKYISVIEENEELRKRIYKYMENDHLHHFMEFMKEQVPEFDPTPYLIEYRKWFDEKKQEEEQ